MTEWQSKSLSISSTCNFRHGLGGALVRLVIAGLFLAAAGGAWASVIPFDDDFQSYTVGTNLDGSNDWNVAGSGSVTVTNHLASQRAALIPNSDTNVIFENDFTDDSNVVSIAFDLQPVYTDGDPTDLIPADATFVYYIGTNGMVTAYDGYQNPSNLTHAKILDDSPTNFVVTLDYANSNWSLYVGGAEIVSEFDFYSSSNADFNQISFLESSSTSYLDNVDIKAPPLVYFDVASGEYAEGSSVTVTARLSTAYGTQITVNHAIGGGTGDAGDIESYSPGLLTFPSGVTETNFTFTVKNDIFGEEAETLLFELSNVTNGILGSPLIFTLTIPDDTSDWSLPFTEDFEARTEGDLDAQNGWQATGAEVQTTTFIDTQAASVTSSTGVASHPFGDGQTNVWTDLHIQPAFGDNSSTNPPDDSTFAFFVNSSSNLVVYSGNSTRTLTGVTITQGEWVRFTVQSDYANSNWDLYVDGVPVTNDVDFYTNTTPSYEEFGVRGGGSSSVPFDDVYISTNPPAPFVTFAMASNTYVEGSTATGYVALSWASASNVTVDVTDLLSGTATNAGLGQDYTFSSPSNLTIFAGTTNLPFTFVIEQDDDGEPAETIEFGLANCDGCSEGDITNFTAYIDIDPSDVPDISFQTNAVSLAESTGVVTVTVEVSVPYNIDTVKVDYAVSGTATPNVDYTNYSDGTLILDPGETSTNFTFEVIDDLEADGDETVIFGLSNFVNCSDGTHTQITYTILEDVGDEKPNVHFASSEVTVFEGVGTLIQDVYLTKTYNGTVTIEVEDTLSGTATNGGVDYTMGITNLTFLTGSTSEQYSVAINNDTIGEDSDTIILQLSNVSGATISAPSTHTITISDDVYDWGLPFYEDFEARVEASLDGQHGWDALDATVQSNSTYAGSTYAGSINSETGFAIHPFSDGKSNVWTDIYIQPVFGDSSSTNPPSGSSFAFYVNTSSNVVVYDGLSTQTLSSVSLTEGEWVRFTMFSDYANTNWDLYVNGELEAEDLDFYYSGATNYTEFGVKGAGASNAPVDDVAITLIPPFSTQPTVSFASALASFAENAGTVTGSVVLSWAHAVTVRVDHAVSGGSADTSDYASYTPETMIFDPGETNKTFTFDIVNDTEDEMDETIIFELSSFVNGIAGTPTNFTCTITSDTNDWYVLPFLETFEDRTLSDLSGQHGWYALDSDVINAPAPLIHAGSQAGLITTGVVSHTFNDGQSNVWTDLYIKPEFGAGHDSVTNPLANSSFAFYVYTNGQVVAFDGRSSPTEFAHTPLTAGEWARFTVYSDYAETSWDLYLNGSQIAGNLDFVDTTAPWCYTEFGVRGGGPSDVAIDDVNITLSRPIPLLDPPSGAIFILR